MTTSLVAYTFNLHFAEPEDFFVLSVPHLHFEGQGNARAKERVLNRLLTYIATEVETRELRQVGDMVVDDDFPIPPPPRRDSQERQKRRREPSSNSPTESRPHACPPTPRDSSTIPRASKVPRIAP